MGLVTALAGCALVTQNPPQVEVATVALTSIGLFNQNFPVTLCVTNTNPTQIAFNRVAFQIAVANAPWLKVRQNPLLRFRPWRRFWCPSRRRHPPAICRVS